MPQAVFEIMGRKGELDGGAARIARPLLRRVSLLSTRQWDEARRAFAEAIAIDPNDGPSITFLNRLEKLILHPPDDDWDGSWRLEQK